MLTIKKFYNFLDTIFLSYWGVTLIDIFPDFNANFLESVDGKIKLAFSVVGFIYFTMKTVFYVLEKIIDWKIKRIDQESKELDLKKKKNK